MKGFLQYFYKTYNRGLCTCVQVLSIKLFVNIMRKSFVIVLLSCLYVSPLQVLLSEVRLQPTIRVRRNVGPS